MNDRERDEYFFGIARSVATGSTCNRKQVGAVLVKNKRIIGCGYNGAPSGARHCTDFGCIVIDNHCVRTIHAEQNAIDYCQNTELALGATLYCTLKPCEKCTGYLAWHGVRDLRWEEDYGI